MVELTGVAKHVTGTRELQNESLKQIIDQCHNPGDACIIWKHRYIRNIPVDSDRRCISKMIIDHLLKHFPLHRVHDEQRSSLRQQHETTCGNPHCLNETHWIYKPPLIAPNRKTDYKTSLGFLYERWREPEHYDNTRV